MPYRVPHARTEELEMDPGGPENNSLLGKVVGSFMGSAIRIIPV